MATKSERFPYRARIVGGELLPLVPICLQGRSMPVESEALVDSGATISVLPRSIGEQLNLGWNEKRRVMQIGGLNKVSARLIRLRCQIGTLKSLNLGFAWVEDDSLPLVLGQLDFFLFHKVCFYRNDEAFEITPAQKRTP